MKDHHGNAGDENPKKQVVAALLDERIADAQRNHEVHGRPGPVATHRTLPSSHDQVFSTSSKSVQDARSFAKSDLRVDLSLDRPYQSPTVLVTPRGRVAGTLLTSGSQQSVKSGLRRSGGVFHDGDTQTLMELEERIAYKMAIPAGDKNYDAIADPQEQAPPRAPAPSKDATAVEITMRDPNEKKDISTPIFKVTGNPTESVPKTAGTKNEACGVYSHDDADLNDPAGKLAVAIAVSEDDDDVFIPAAIQYDPDSKPPMIRNRRCRLYSLLACTLMLVVVVGMAVLLILQQTDDAQDAATDSPVSDFGTTEAPTRPDANGIIEQLERIVGSEVLAEVDGAYVRAKEWLIYEDPMQLTAHDSNLVQRYLLAVVYFKLHEEGDWLSCNAPSDEEPHDYCLYQQLVNISPLEYQPVPWYRWLSGKHECQWAGLACDEFEQLRSIDMVGQDIAGTLPIEFLYFDYIQDISLSWNKLRGTIPSEYGNMRHLLSFEVHYNELTGSLPTGWSKFMTLQLFNVAANMLSGSIPQEFLTISSLKGLFLFENMLTGTFPSELSQMSLLTYIRMYRNFFTGTLPSEIGLLSPQELWLDHLPLEGTIPSEIGKMGDILDLRLHKTALTGNIPEELWDLTKLSRLDLYDTQLSGSLSPSVAQLTDLVILRLRNSGLTGTIPESVSFLPNLETAWLDGNDFVGTVPSSICAHEVIEELTADCLDSGDAGVPQVTCACCDICCDHESGFCDDIE